MRAITMREFARLCADDPDIHQQVLDIPKTISPEKIFALAERNGFQIVPEGGVLCRPLEEGELELVTGGTEPELSRGQMADWLTWLHIWTGIGEEPGPRPEL